MKLLSNFDTNLDEVCYQENAAKYGKDKIIMVYKDYIFFMFYVLIPLLGAGAWLLFTILLLIFLDWGEFKFLGRLLFIGSFIFLIFSVVKLAVKKYLDYKMDFTIITPDIIMAYNQTGFFSRDSRSIRTNKIKTISIDKKGLIKSIFNYGSLIFLSEGDEKGKGDITLLYVQNPDQVRSKIKDIIEFENSSQD